MVFALVSCLTLASFLSVLLCSLFQDYKGGWQLENDWNKAQEERRKRVLAGGSADAEDTNYEIAQEEDMPWACLICREEFKNPVVTKCKHYFCENVREEERHGWSEAG